MRFFCAALAATLSLSALADDVTVQEATGEAAIVNGDKAAAREKAIDDALRKAVSMAVGVRLTSTQQVENYQTKLDEILTRAAGFVKGYEVVKEQPDGDTGLQVTVRAKVSTVQLDKDLEAIGLLIARKNKPRTMLLIGEQNIGMSASYEPWKQQAKEVSFDLRVSESAMLEALQKKGFKVIDAEIATQKAVSVGGITNELTAQQARELKRLTAAEVIVVGRVVAVAEGEADPELFGKGYKKCSATLTARAVNTDNGDVLASAQETKGSNSPLGDLACGKRAIASVTEVATEKLLEKILDRWNQDVSGGNQVKITAKVSSAGQARQLRTALTQVIRGVKSVSQKSFNDGVAELEIVVLGSTEQLAEEMESKKLGAFKVRVKGYTANTVDVELADQ